LRNEGGGLPIFTPILNSVSSLTRNVIDLELYREDSKKMTKFPIQ